MKRYLIKSCISGLYWNDKKGTVGGWTGTPLADKAYYTKEDLEVLKKEWLMKFGIDFFDDNVVIKEIDIKVEK